MQEIDEIGHLGLDLVFGAEDVGIVLDESTHAHQAVQGAGHLVAVARTELGQAQWQVAIGLEALVEHLHMAGAVHRLDRELPALGFQREHVLAELGGMAGFLPQREIHQLRRVDFLVAVGTLLFAHVLLDVLVQGPAAVVPEDLARRLFLDVEQVELLADTAMIALLGLFQAMQIGLQFLLVAPGSAVDALQHFVARVAAPVGTGHLHQLEALAQLAGGRQVRTAADIEPVALAVDGNFLALGNDIVDDLDLVLLAQLVEDFLRFLAIQHLALDRQIALDDLLHALLDLLEIFRGEGLLAGKIVVEAVLDGRADGDLGAGIEFLNRLRHDMGGIVTHQLKGFLVAGGDDRQLGIVIDQPGGVHQLTVQLAGQGRLGQAGTDVAGHIHDRDRMIVFALGTVGKGNAGHGDILCQWRPLPKAAWRKQERPLKGPSRSNLVGAIGFEPTTPTMSRWCSNQLSYAPAIKAGGHYTRLQPQVNRGEALI